MTYGKEEMTKKTINLFMLLFLLIFMYAGFYLKVSPFLLLFIWISVEIPLAIKLESFNVAKK